MGSRYVIIYDGECGFCRRQINWIRSRDRSSCFEFVPRQTDGVEERFPALKEQDFETGLRLIRPDGTVRVGADGVYEIARRLPGYRILALIYRVPGFGFLGRQVYAWIARNRQRLSGQCESGTCAVEIGPGPAESGPSTTNDSRPNAG